METDTNRIEEKAMHGTTKGFTGRFENMAGSGDLFLKLPEAFVKSEDWRSDDVLSFEIQPGQVFVINKSKVSREQEGDVSHPLV